MPEGIVTEEPITEEKIRQAIEKIPFEKVYYTLKMMKIKPIKIETVHAMRICLALHQLKLPISAYSVAHLKGTKVESVLRNLHILGDKKALTFIRGSKTIFLRWMVSDLFLSFYEG